jgi:hypothetical protein
MTKDQRKRLKKIFARWHVSSYKSLTLEQASLDIGFLCGLLAKEYFDE